jgi:tRNA pseudouridine38-40 synthase
MRTIKLVVTYDGSDYVGWQRQGKGTSVQGLIEEALEQIDGAPVTLHGAGRTDAGVHAVGQVATARIGSPIEDWQLIRALNAHLPKSIRVTELTTVADDFHARFSATGKTYEYRIWNGRTMPPFIRQYAWHVIEPLNLALMQEASRAIPGEHDFAAFRSARSINHTTVREITSATWFSEGRGEGQKDGGKETERTLIFQIAGKGFLRYMVRSLVGTMVEIGRGQRPAGDIGRLLASPDRAQAGRTAPARGLFLMKVDY